MNSRLASISNKQQEESTPSSWPSAILRNQMLLCSHSCASCCRDFSFLGLPFRPLTVRVLDMDVLSIPRRFSGAALEGILGHTACNAASASFYSHCLPGFNNDKGLVLTFPYLSLLPAWVIVSSALPSSYLLWSNLHSSIRLLLSLNSRIECFWLNSEALPLLL